MKKFVMPKNLIDQLMITRSMLGYVEKAISSIPKRNQDLEMSISEAVLTHSPETVRELWSKKRILRMQELCLLAQRDRLNARVDQLSGITE